MSYEVGSVYRWQRYNIIKPFPNLRPIFFLTSHNMYKRTLPTQTFAASEVKESFTKGCTYLLSTARTLSPFQR